MALLCCFLLIVEKIPIVECEKLYELTWAPAPSQGSKWPLGRPGPRHSYEGTAMRPHHPGQARPGQPGGRRVQPGWELVSP